MIIRSNSQNKMSLRELLSLSFIFTLMIAITSINLVFSNSFGETCGFLHPYIFEAQVSIIDPGGGLNWNSDLTNLPADESDVRVMDSFLRVYDQNGVLVASDDDTIDGDRASGSTIERFGLSEGGSVIVEVGTYGDSGSGRYEVVVSTSEPRINDTLQLGSNASGTIYAGITNRISYPLVLAAGETIIVRASGVQADQSMLDTFLRLYDASETLINQNDDFGSLSSALIISNSTEAAVSYRLEMGTYNDATSGQYTISVESFAIETIAGQSLSLDLPVNSNLLPLQRVRHEISLEANSSPVISLYGQDDTGFELGLALRVYDENENLLQEVQGYSYLSISDIQMEAAGRLIIEVGTAQDAFGGYYELTVSNSPVVEATPELTQEAAQFQIIDAAPISLGTERSGQIEAGQRIRYPFSISAGQTIAAYASGTNLDGNSLDTTLTLYDATGAVVAFNDDYNGLGSAIINFPVTEDSEFILELATFSDIYAGEFNLQLQPYEMDIPVMDAVQIGDTVEGRIALGQRIRYPIRLEPGQNLSLYLHGIRLDGLQLDTAIRLLDSDGNEITSNDDFYSPDFNAGLSSGIEDFSVEETTELLIEVATYSDASEGEYTLYILSSLAELPTGFEEIYARAINYVLNTELDAGRVVTGALESNQRQQYPFYMDALSSIIIRLSGESVFEGRSYPFSTVLRIYDSDEQLLTEAYPDQNYEILLIFTNTKNTPSYITLEVASFEDYYSGNFQLQVLENSIENFEQVYGIQIIEGRELTLEEAPYVAGELNENERNRHELELAEGQIIVVNFGGFSRLDTVARLYSQENNLLAEAYSFGRETGSLRYRAPGEGSYFVEIGTFGDAESGEYEILVLEVSDAGSLTVDDIGLSGDIKPNQRSQYTLNLEAGQTVDISVRQIVPESEEATLFSWSRFALSGDPNAAQQWVSCLEYYGYVVDSAFRVNEYGISRFVLGTKIEDLCDPLREACQLEATVKLTAFGQILLYVLLPGLAIILPVMTVLILQNDRVIYWVIGLVVVAIFVLTSSLLYVHLGTVSGISALQDFGSGIFGGTATGAAIAFMSKVLENFSERKTRHQDEAAETPPANPEA